MKKFYLVFVAVFLLPAGAFAQQKYALVIGNGDYTNTTQLNNPVNDANDMTAALTGLGFQVDKILNGTLDQMDQAVVRLKNRLSTNASAYGFFFYAGHGVQSNGENYLIPVDASIASESFLRSRALQVQAVLDELNTASNTLNIVVLDACRDNPFSWARSGTRGLNAVMGQPADSIIVYATSAGSTAKDGTGRNGVFTGELLKHLSTLDIDIIEVFRRTGADVQRVSNREQVPAIYNQFFGTAYLGGNTPPAPQSVVTPQVPRNVRAGTPGTDSVQLTWDSAGVGISYRVYYNTQNNASGASVFNNSTGTSLNVTSIKSDSIYYFWVTSVQNGQESAKSPVLTGRTIPANFVRIPGGTFMMGSPSSEPNRDDDEVQHRVTITGFSMSKYEVTVGEFRRFVNATGYKTTAETSGGGYIWMNRSGSWELELEPQANWQNPYVSQGENHPVTQVSWYDAIEYCNWLSWQAGLTPAYIRNGNDVTWNRSANGYRLPTEAEWEYACRAGTTTPYYTGTSVDNAGWYGGNASGMMTHPVGQRQANSWGLYDMHGNLWEWCWDWYSDYSTSPRTDPTGVASGTYRVLRGGSWYRNAQLLRSAYRDCDPPTYRNINYGFRVVLP